jgi:hypothetical protein
MVELLRLYERTTAMRGEIVDVRRETAQERIAARRAFRSLGAVETLPGGGNAGIPLRVPGVDDELLDELQRRRGLATIVRHVLLLLIVGSGINWAHDEELGALVEKLGSETEAV